MDDRNREEASSELAAVIEEVRPQLRRTLKAYRIPVPDSEDLLQDALLVLVAKWEHIREPGPWLVAVLRHLCGVYVRRQRRCEIVRVDEAELERLAGAAPGSEAQHGIRLDLERVVRRLTPRHRWLVGLSFWLGFDAREISQVLGGGEPASLRRTRGRAITRLRELMAVKSAGNRRPRTKPA
jgi:RNA polymerase sigma factor (sigma-70 family)